MSYSACSFQCSYCFADGSGRNDIVREVPAAPTLKHLVNVMRTGGHSAGLADILTLRRFPITFSNGTDPSSFRNLRSTRETLPILAEFDIPVILQTRGARKREDFAEILRMLPRDSVVYMSITGMPGDDAALIKEVEKGCPTNAERCEMAGMAAAAGFPVVLAANPADIDFIPRPDEFFASAINIAGQGAFKGVWLEPMHLHRKQGLVMLGKHKAATPEDLPLIVAGAYARARSHRIDGFWARDLWSAMTTLFERYYSIGMPSTINDGAARLFDLWPNPFPTHHNFVAACREASQAAYGSPVLVTFETFCSWVDPLNEVMDIEITRGDAWTLINGKNDVDGIEWAHLPETFSLRECLRFLWRRPKTRVQAIYGAYGLKGLVETLGKPPEDAEEAEDGDGFLSPKMLVSEDPELARWGFREDDDTPLAVWAPQSKDWTWTTDRKDRLRLVDEIERDHPVMLAPLDPEDLAGVDDEVEAASGSAR